MTTRQKTGRQTIHVHLGQFGVHSGKSVWELYCKEHGIGKDGTISENAPIENMFRFNHFTESHTGMAKPKSLFLDMSHSAIDGILNSDIKRLFDHNYMIIGEEDAANNFARARYGVQRSIFVQMFDKMRSLLEECDCAKTCITFRASGGGCGSGVSPGALQFVHDQSLKSILVDLAPSNNLTNYMLTPYNHILSLAQCDGVCDMVIPIQNECLEASIRRHAFHGKKSHEMMSYSHLNEEIAYMMSHLSIERFYGDAKNCLSMMSWSGMVQNLLPFSDLKYMTTYTSRHVPQGRYSQERDVKSMILSCLENSYLSTVPTTSLYIADCFIFRGDAPYDGFFPCFEKYDQDPYKRHHGNRFVPYIPCRVRLCNASSPVLIPDKFITKEINQTCIRLSNESGIKEFFLDNLEKYSAMFNILSHVHWYTNEGMEHDEFEQAFDQVKNLVCAYDTVLDRDENAGANEDKNFGRFSNFDMKSMSMTFNNDGDLDRNYGPKDPSIAGFFMASV